MEFIAYRKAGLDLSVIANDTMNVSFQLVTDDLIPVDLSTYTSAKCQIKQNEISSPMYTLFDSTNTGQSRIIITQLNLGIISLYAPVLELSAGQYLYDIELKNSATIETIVGGYFNVTYDITN